MNFILVAPGESLTQAQCEEVRKADAQFIAVCDAYKLFGMPDVLVGTDRAWWDARPEVQDFTCRKFSIATVSGCERIQPNGVVNSGTNSGALAIWVARMLGATRILLLGYDMQGSHFFGPHTGKLKNTSPSRFAVFQSQFEQMKHHLNGIEVFNVTQGSALKAFPIIPLAEGLQWLRSKLAA